MSKGKKVALITVHAMGDHNPNYYGDLVRKLRLRKYVGEKHWQRVHVEAVDYQKLLQSKQEDFWYDIDEKYSLRWDFLRKFMLCSFADAAVIEHSLHGDQTLYLNVHKEIGRAFDACFEALGKKKGPVAVIAQSLGAEQMSNYIWDAMAGKRLFKPPPKTERDKFRRLPSCELLVTTGCNIPLFRASLPEPKVFERPNAKFRWMNFFDRDDCLGYPIRGMSESYDVDWIEDLPVSVGGFATGWNPACHMKYWTDHDVLAPIAAWIRSRSQ